MVDPPVQTAIAVTSPVYTSQCEISVCLHLFVPCEVSPSIVLSTGNCKADMQSPKRVRTVAKIVHYTYVDAWSTCEFTEPTSESEPSRWSASQYFASRTHAVSALKVGRRDVANFGESLSGIVYLWLPVQIYHTCDCLAEMGQDTCDRPLSTVLVNDFQCWEVSSLSLLISWTDGGW